MSKRPEILGFLKKIVPVSIVRPLASFIFDRTFAYKLK